MAWFKEHAIPSFNTNNVKEMQPLANKLFVNNNGDPIKIHITSKDVSKPQKSEYLEKRHRLLVFDYYIVDTDGVRRHKDPQYGGHTPQDITHEHCTLEQYISTDKNQIPFEVFCRLLGFDTKTKRCGDDKPSFKVNQIAPSTQQRIIQSNIHIWPKWSGKDSPTHGCNNFNIVN